MVMKIAIMQPYLFPYIGYFQLINSVDKFIFYDDVNFIRRGWINRNRFLLSGIPHYFTVPVIHASATTKIKDIRIFYGSNWQKKLSFMLYHAYSKAPYFSHVKCLFEDILFSGESSISDMAKQSIIIIAEEYGIKASFILSSSQYENSTLRGMNRIIDICCRENAETYLNLPGGDSLYDAQIFAHQGIKLQIIQPKLDTYKQFASIFYPNLSILDVLMFNDRNVCRKMFNLD